MDRRKFPLSRHHRNRHSLIVLAALLLLLPSTVWAATASGTGALNGTAAPTSPVVGTNVSITVKVNLTGVTDLSPVGPAALGAYDISVGFDKTKLQYLSAVGNNATGFGGVTTTNAGTANSTGTLKMNGANSSQSPTGNVAVATLTFKTLATGSTSINLTRNSLASTQYNDINATAGAVNFSIVNNAPPPPPGCSPVGLPQNLQVQPEVGNNITYTVSWNEVNAAGEYTVQESLTPDFASSVEITVPAPTHQASFTHNVVVDTIYYYRVRARKFGGCADDSPYTAAVSILVHRTPEQRRIIPIVGSAPGNLGSYFRTAAQLYNSTDSPISGKLIFHPEGTVGTDNDPSLEYTIDAGRTLVFDDVVVALGQGGKGSLDLLTESPLPTGAFRIFNDGGAAGTTGFFSEMLDPNDALQAGDSFALIAPIDTTAARMNIGVRTLGSGATLEITLKSRDGNTIHTTTRSYPANYVIQVSDKQFTDYANGLLDSDVVIVKVTAGSAFVYGALTDNTTQDPAIQLGRR